MEFLLLKWLEDKQVQPNLIQKNAKNFEDLSFTNTIEFYKDTGKNQYDFEIGIITQWKIIDNIIRDYRNYIHLKKYETERINNNNFLTEQNYQSLRRKFDSIIKLC